MKRRNIILATVLMVCLYAGSGVAETLTIDTGAPVAPGATDVQVTIALDTGENTAGASFTVIYDDSMLSLTDVSSSYFDTFSSTVTVGAEAYDQALAFSPVASGVMLAGARATEGTPQEQTLFTLTFNVSEGASGSVPIDIVPSVIDNPDTGYTSPTIIPMLVGINESTSPVSYPSITPSLVGDVVAVQAGSSDSDSDGIPDSWELAYFNDLTVATGTSDFDRDGYTDLQEYLNGGSYDPTRTDAPGGAGYINRLADSLIVNFPGYGLYTYNNLDSFTRINSVEPLYTVACDIDSDQKDEIISFFEGYGLYTYNDGVWLKITTVVPDEMVQLEDAVAVDFGSNYGLYTYNTTRGWTRINSEDPEHMVSVDIDQDGSLELVVSFPGFGLYIWDDGSWSKMNHLNVEGMMKLNNSLVVDFGTSWGLYIYSASAWTRINQVSPTIMSEADIDSDGEEELLAFFQGYGFYYLNEDTWSRINTATPENIVGLNNSIAVDFGSQYGLYLYSIADGWTLINRTDPARLVSADLNSDGTEELAVSFPGYGLYLWDNSNTWTRINSVLPDMLISGNIID